MSDRSLAQGFAAIFLGVAVVTVLASLGLGCLVGWLTGSWLLGIGFNIGDKGGRKVRSMSVGDIVIVDFHLWTEAFVCQSSGWKKIDLKDPTNVQLVSSLLSIAED